MPNKGIRFRLKEVLFEKGMSQTELSQKSGVGESAISNICNNKNERVDLNTIYKLVKTLEIDFNTLMEIVSDDKEEDS